VAGSGKMSSGMATAPSARHPGAGSACSSPSSSSLRSLVKLPAASTGRVDLMLMDGLLIFLGTEGLPWTHYGWRRRPARHQIMERAVERARRAVRRPAPTGEGMGRRMARREVERSDNQSRPARPGANEAHERCN